MGGYSTISPPPPPLAMLLTVLLFQSEVSQKLETKLFLSHIWQDQRMTWIPRANGGITTLHIPAEQLWFPEFVLYNK